MTNAFAKKRAEGSEALKSDFETHLSHAQAARSQQLFRLLDSLLNQVLVWCRIELFAKQPEKMIRRQTGLLRNLHQIQRQIVRFINKAAGAAKKDEKNTFGWFFFCFLVRVLLTIASVIA